MCAGVLISISFVFFIPFFFLLTRLEKTQFFVGKILSNLISAMQWISVLITIRFVWIWVKKVITTMAATVMQAIHRSAHTVARSDWKVVRWYKTTSGPIKRMSFIVVSQTIWAIQGFSPNMATCKSFPRINHCAKIDRWNGFYFCLVLRRHWYYCRSYIYHCISMDHRLEVSWQKKMQIFRIYSIE